MAARERLAPLLDRPGQQELTVTPLLPLAAWAALEAGDAAECVRLLAEVEERAAPERLQLPLVEARRVAALRALRGGDHAAAETALTEGLAFTRAIPHPYFEAKLLYTSGLLAAQTDGPDAARERFTAARAILTRLGERLYTPHVERALETLA